MAKLARGTVLTIDQAFLEADNALKALQAMSIETNLSENGAKAAGYGHLFTNRNRTWRKATGSQNTLTYCPCRKVNPHVTPDLVTDCCGSRTVVVCG